MQREINGQLYAKVKLPNSSVIEYTLGLHDSIIGLDGKMCVALPPGTYKTLLRMHGEAQRVAQNSGGLTSA